jgi:hypothetical protein
MGAVVGERGKGENARLLMLGLAKEGWIDTLGEMEIRLAVEEPLERGMGEVPDRDIGEGPMERGMGEVPGRDIGEGPLERGMGEGAPERGDAVLNLRGDAVLNLRCGDPNGDVDPP